MRYVRGTIVAAATVAGVAGVLALNPSGAEQAAVAAASTGSDVSGETGDAAAESSTDKAGASAGSGAAATAEPGATPSAGDTAGTTTTYTGSVYTTPWGPIQLEATIADGSIVDITWISIPSDRHSAGINNRAAPALVEEALAAQSATVDSISGASWTSEGFRYSLQSILDQAGL